jgi:hypothetical protein
MTGRRASDVFVSVPTFAQILPMRVGGENQGHFLGPQPAFDLFLPSDRSADVAKGFIIHKAVDVVLPSEAGEQLALMLEDALLQVVGDACVKCPSVVGHDVDVVGFHCGQPLRVRQHTPISSC